MRQPCVQIEPKLLVYTFNYGTTVTNKTLVQNQEGIKSTLLSRNARLKIRRIDAAHGAERTRSCGDVKLSHAHTVTYKV